jgi:hypothetical protein
MPPIVFRPGPTTTRRLPNPTRIRGTRTGLSLHGGLLFGAAFVGVGTWLVLIGLRIVEPGGHFNVPRWVMTPIGAVFGIGGFFMWGKIWLQRQAERRHAQVMLWNPNQPALADYPWDPSGARSELRQQAIRATVIAIFFILFLIPFNYVAFFGENPHWLFGGLVGLFDLITVYLLFDLFLRWGRAFKFGQALLRFESFPYSTHKPVKLTWIAPTGCRGSATGSFTLRAIREWHETTGSTKNRSNQLVHEQQWSGTWEITEPTPFTPGQNYAFTFDLPAGAPSTAMQAERPLFWEFEVTLRLPGLDFNDVYLVPIYGPARA